MAWISRLKWWMIGLTVVCLSIAIYFVFKEDEKKNALRDLTKWSIKKKTEILRDTIDNGKVELTKENQNIEKLKKKIDIIEKERHDIVTKEDSKTSDRQVSNAFRDALNSLN